jgi:hypothetical protein
MALLYVFDENLPGRLDRAVRRHNARGLYVIDSVRVGEPSDLPRGSMDPTILLWFERENRVLVTEDKRTMPHHVAVHLAGGRHTPGVFMIRRAARMPEIVEYLALAAHASDPQDWLDQILYVP